MQHETVRIENPDGLNLILGQSHFIKTVEDVHEALAQASPVLRFGIAFCEASGPRLVRRSGNDDALIELAVGNARAIGAGHAFIVFLDGGFPVSVLNAIKAVPEVVDYAVNLVRITRESQGISLGAGTRGAISLLSIAKAFALMAGRDFVTPDDVKRGVLPVLRHRVAVAPELAISGQSVEGILEALVRSVQAPRQ